MLPLIMIQSGEKAVIRHFHDDGSEFNRIRSMGLEIDSLVTVVTSQSSLGGPVLVSVKGCKYAIDYNLALRIMVQPKSS